MDDIISYNIDTWRDMLHIAIENNKELTSDYVLKLSQELDKKQSLLHTKSNSMQIINNILYKGGA